MIAKIEYEVPELLVITFGEAEDVVTNSNEIPLPSVPVG